MKPTRSINVGCDNENFSSPKECLSQGGLVICQIIKL